MLEKSNIKYFNNFHRFLLIHEMLISCFESEAKNLINFSKAPFFGACVHYGASSDEKYYLQLLVNDEQTKALEKSQRRAFC